MTGPLASEWQRVSTELRAIAPLTEQELEMMRVMFFYGAKTALLAASCGTTMAQEMAGEIIDRAKVN